MNNNYEWQKYHTNEKVQARLRNAELHRLSKQAEISVPKQKRQRKMIQFTGAKGRKALASLAGWF